MGRIAIVGGGVNGLSIAYNLAKYGFNDVDVYEKRYVGSGSSTRNANHFRVHFWAKENVVFAIESRKRLINLGLELGWNPLIDPGGYLFLLYDEELVRAYKEGNKLWKSFGVGGRFLSPGEVRELYPYINTNGVLEAFFGPQDGQFHHDFITFGYYTSAVKMGVRVFEYTPVEQIVVKNGKVAGLTANGKFREYEKVVVAAGGWSNTLLGGCGVYLPLTPERKEIGVTEPVAYFIEPLVINTKLNGYVGQTIRGEVLGSVDYPKAPNVTRLTNTAKWLFRYVKMLVSTIPSLKHLSIMRVWSGFYEVTPDHSHIMGRDPEWPEGLYVLTGFSGHGFMMAPYAGELMAKYLLEDKVHEHMKPFLPTRFKEGRLIGEGLVVG